MNNNTNDQIDDGAKDQWIEGQREELLGRILALTRISLALTGISLALTALAGGMTGLSLAFTALAGGMNGISLALTALAVAGGIEALDSKIPALKPLMTAYLSSSLMGQFVILVRFSRCLRKIACLTITSLRGNLQRRAAIVWLIRVCASIVWFTYGIIIILPHIICLIHNFKK